MVFLLFVYFVRLPYGLLSTTFDEDESPFKSIGIEFYLEWTNCNGDCIHLHLENCREAFANCVIGRQSVLLVSELNWIVCYFSNVWLMRTNRPKYSRRYFCMDGKRFLATNLVADELQTMSIENKRLNLLVFGLL